MAPTWSEFRQRKLGQWTLGYLAGAWLAYEVLSQVAENFSWNPVVMRVVTVLLVAGLPLVMVLGWYHGEQGRQKPGLVEVLLLAAIVAGAGLGVAAVAGDAGRPATTAPRSAAGDVLLNSIAVLPLANRSPDPEQEYFADGLTEEIMGALARVPGLRLAARTSSFAFKGSAAGLDSIARTLNVRHLLDGSVYRQGDSLRVSIALIDARDRYELWSETYRRPMTDVFAIEREIARAVVERLPLDPVILEAQWRPPERSTNVEAFDLYLLGKEAWNRRTGPDLLRAIELFERALTLDSAYAPAWAALAETYVLLPGYTTVSARTSYDRLQETALRALELDSLNVQAHTALGSGTVWYGSDFPAGVARLDRALEIDPDYANALHWQGEVLAHAGRFHASWDRFELALQVDPLSRVTVADYGQALQLGGRYDRAIELLEGLLADDPDYLIAQFWLFFPCLLTGRYERAEQLGRDIARGVGLEPEGVAVAVRGIAGRLPVERAIAALDEQPRSVSGIGLLALAALYAQLGDLDAVFAALDTEAGTPVQTEMYMVTHPVFEPVRADPRFRAIVDGITWLPGTDRS